MPFCKISLNNISEQEHVDTQAILFAQNLSNFIQDKHHKELYLYSNSFYSQMYPNHSLKLQYLNKQYVFTRKWIRKVSTYQPNPFSLLNAFTKWVDP